MFRVAVSRLSLVARALGFSLLLILVSPKVGVAQAFPEPSAQPTASSRYYSASDQMLVVCLPYFAAGNDPPAELTVHNFRADGLGLTDFLNWQTCVFQKKDWLATIFMGDIITADIARDGGWLNARLNEEGALGDGDYINLYLPPENDGESLYDMAYAYYNLGDYRNAARFIERAARTSEAAYDETGFGGGNDYVAEHVNLEMKIFPEEATLLRRFDRAQAHVLDHLSHSLEREVEASVRAEVASFSADQMRIYNEEGDPCHKETYASANYRSDTWWYCDDDGNYRKAYTFVNGVLQSVYNP